MREKRPSGTHNSELCVPESTKTIPGGEVYTRGMPDTYRVTILIDLYHTEPMVGLPDLWALWGTGNSVLRNTQL